MSECSSLHCNTEKNKDSNCFCIKDDDSSNWFTCHFVTLNIENDDYETCCCTDVHFSCTVAGEWVIDWVSDIGSEWMSESEDWW